VSKSIPKLVDEFARHLVAQRQAMERDDVAAGNRHADKYIAAWDALVDEHGDAGRDGLAILLRDPRIDVRTMAAAFLLRHKTKESSRVLEEAKAAGHFGAEQTLERWREGTWNLDSAPPPKPEG
jgi:hypothetical protein